MAESPDAASQRSGRKPYHKPDVTRVDLIEDEVALASCKQAVPATISSPGQISPPTKICRSSCRTISPT